MRERSRQRSGESHSWQREGRVQRPENSKDMCPLAGRSCKDQHPACLSPALLPQLWREEAPVAWAVMLRVAERLTNDTWRTLSVSLGCSGLPRSRCCLLPQSNLKKLWKTLKETGTVDRLTCLLRNVYAGQEAKVRTLYGTTDWFKIGEGVQEGCLLSLCLLIYIQSTLCEILGWMSYKLESRLLGEISTTSDMQTIPL